MWVKYQARCRIRPSSLMRIQLSPPSSERNSPPSFDSIRAYTRLGSAPETDTPMRPMIPEGKPWPSRRVHVAPPSIDLYNPLLAPPLLRLHGLRYTSHKDAKRVLALLGSKTTSIAPVLLSLYNTFCHVVPPSRLRKIPRSSLGP